jgi:hypothetical protein
MEETAMSLFQRAHVEVGGEFDGWSVRQAEEIAAASGALSSPSNNVV